MHAWMGKVIRIDLSKGKISKEPLNAEWAKDYVGARGLGTKYLYEEVDPNVDPLSAENKMIMAAGPLTATFAPCGGRYEVVTKSPLTGAVAAANSGGAFGPELKFAGYDMIIFEGKSKKPVYIWIDDETVEIRDASALWGKEVPETTEAIWDETNPDAHVSCIGPAGERGSLIACIMNDHHRAAGRSGVGAVMGSKNLKAVAVKGTGSVTVADQKGFYDACLDARNKIHEHPVGGTGLRMYGTNVLTNILNETGGYPTNNFQTAYFENADNVGGETVAAKQLERPRGCFGCIISCGRGTKVTDPKYAGEGEGPEYESAWGFGGDCGIDNIDAVTKANYICNEKGLDTISAGATVACAMELYQVGAITTADTGGLELEFGNEAAMVEAIRLMGDVEGFGKDLAMGSYRLAEKYGRPELSMSVKKQEIPAYDPRAIQGIGLNYATANCGAAHVRGYTISPEILGVPVKVDKDDIDGKPDLVKLFQDLTATIDSSGACLFTTFGIGGDEYAAMMSAATGITYAPEDILHCGDRIYNLERLWNLKAGLSKADDTLPSRLLEEGIPDGNSKGQVSRLSEMLPVYYETRGWDSEGVPTKDKLASLGIAN